MKLWKIELLVMILDILFISAAFSADIWATEWINFLIDIDIYLLNRRGSFDLNEVSAAHVLYRGSSVRAIKSC